MHSEGRPDVESTEKQDGHVLISWSGWWLHRCIPMYEELLTKKSVHLTYIIYTSIRNQNQTTTNYKLCLLSFIEGSHVLMGPQPNQKPDRSSKYSRRPGKGGEWLMILPHLHGNRNHHRQTDRQGLGRTHLPPGTLPLAPIWKESQTLATQHPSPHPTHSSVCGTIPLQGTAPRQLPIALPSLWFAPGNSVPSSFFQPPAHHPHVT